MSRRLILNSVLFVEFQWMSNNVAVFKLLCVFFYYYSIQYFTWNSFCHVNIGFK